MSYTGDYFQSLNKLYGNQIGEKKMSKCCKGEVSKHETENSDYYVCLTCQWICELANNKPE
jgi:hypothetical protein